jgi:hypothetical protein
MQVSLERWSVIANKMIQQSVSGHVRNGNLRECFDCFRGRSKRGGNSSRNLGRRMGSWRGGRQPTRHQLDKQLDTYMSGNDS